MSMLSPDKRWPLEALPTVCASCASTLRSAGELVEDPELRTRLLERAEVWRESAEKLRSVIPNGPERSQIGAAVLVSLRRTWMSVKSAIGDTPAIAAECDRRETEARQRLEFAAATPLQAEIREVLGHILRRTEQLPGIS